MAAAFVSVPESVTDELVAFLVRLGCEARIVGSGSVAVTLPRAVNAAEVERELVVYLSVWNVLQPEGRAVLR